MSLTKKRESVAAIIATYRREELMMAALEAIMGQTRLPDEVIVIDNDKTAVLEEMIKQKYPDVTYKNLGENTGPAGGFSRGMKLAYEHNHQYFWLIEDDCKPKECQCLETLLSYQISSDIPTLVKSTLQDPETGLLKGAGPWHGSLFSRELVALIGFPKDELFFGSEDIEYETRIKKKGFSIIKLTCAGTFMIHSLLPRKTLGYLFKTGYQEPSWRLYYRTRGFTWLQTRNNPITGYLLGTYSTLRLLGIITIFGKYRKAQIGMVLKGFLDGLLGKLGQRVRVER